jgi:hypothetical protein
MGRSLLAIASCGATLIALACSDSGDDAEASGAGGTISSAGGGPATGDPDSEGRNLLVPAETTLEGVAAFLDAGNYKGPGWTPETPTPRDADGSHSQQVQVWMNAVATAGQAKDTEDLPVDSMAVKELYSDGQLTGIAAMVKTSEGTSSGAWVFYCYGPSGRCSNSDPEAPKESPIYGTGLNVSCGFCHSTIITR